MNLYFVVEGKTESAVYSAWLSYLLPELCPIKSSQKAKRNNYFLVSGGGYPSMYEMIEVAIEEIHFANNYNYLVICLDADENSVNEIQQEVQEEIEKLSVSSRFYLKQTVPKIIVQNRCIETWFLGNSKIYPRQQPNSPDLLNCTNYYNVSVDCPELMGKYNSNTHAQFHADYLKKIFVERNIKYSKGSTSHVQEEQYLKSLKNRIKRQSTHLPSFQNFIAFCDLVRSQL